MTSRSGLRLWFAILVGFGICENLIISFGFSFYQVFGGICQHRSQALSADMMNMSLGRTWDRVFTGFLPVEYRNDIRPDLNFQFHQHALAESIDAQFVVVSETIHFPAAWASLMLESVCETRARCLMLERVCVH